MNNKELRDAFLLELYNLVDGSTRKSSYVKIVAANLRLDIEKANDIASVLHDQYLIEIQTKDRDIVLTTEGIDEVENRYFNHDSQELTKDELKSLLKEIISKIDMLSVGQEVLFNAVDDITGDQKRITLKDYKLIILSLLLSKGIDLNEILNLIESLRTN